MTQRGFTLIELLVVLVIVGILLAVSVPFIAPHTQRAAVAGAVDEMVSALRLTRSRAIHDGRPETLVVDVGKARYWNAGDTHTAGFPAGTRLVLTTSEDERQSPALGSIRFFPDGSSTGGGVTVEEGPVRYDVLVDWLTGAISVHAVRS
jgi:general secretion pathway protein H